MLGVSLKTWTRFLLRYNRRSRITHDAKFTPEFPQSIIDLYHSGTSASQLAKDYGVSVATIFKWTNRSHTAPQNPIQTNDIKRLEQRALKAESELDILKNP